MGINAIKNQEMLAYKSDCYVGMTAEEAKVSGRSVFRDFKKINTDSDDVISFDEIIAQRDKKSNKKRNWGNVSMALGAYYSINGIILEKVNPKALDSALEMLSKGSKEVITPTQVKGRNLAWVLLFAGIGIIKYLKSKKIDKETQEYANSYYKQIAT